MKGKGKLAILLLILAIMPSMVLGATSISGLAVSNITDTSALISFNVVDTAKYYEVYINNNLYAYTDKNSLKLEGLTPNASYDVYIVANDGNTAIAQSATLSFKTLPERPTKPEKPVLERVYKETNSAVIKWESLADRYQIKKYRVYVNNMAVADVYQPGPDQFAQLTNLEIGKAYTVRVIGINENGEGELSEELSFKIGDIGAITNLKLINVFTDRAYLRWDPAQNAIRYNVYLNGSLVGSTNETTYKFENLTPGSVYNVSIVPIGPGKEEGTGQNISFNTESLPTDYKAYILQNIKNYANQFVIAFELISAIGGAFYIGRILKRGIV